MKYPEAELVEQSIKILNKDYTVYTEVGMYGVYADIVLIDYKGDIYAVECKINKPNQAIKQAEKYKRFSDYSMILLPKKDYPIEVLNKCKELGIGFWQYKEEENILDCVIQPQWNDGQSIPFKNMMIEKLILRDKL